LDERGLALVEQNPIYTAIEGILCIHRDYRQAGATIEGRRPNVGDAAWNRDAGQVSAQSERLVFDGGDTVGNRVAADFAPWALDERGLALVEQNPIHTAIEGVERIHRDCCQAGTVKIRTGPDIGDTIGDRDAYQAGAAIERIVLNTGNAIGDRDVSQFVAIKKCPIPDACDTIAYRNTSQVGAAVERPLTDTSSPVRNQDTR